MLSQRVLPSAVHGRGLTLRWRAFAAQDWEQAAELFDKMRQRGCKPDGASFTALIVALQAGGQWCRALQTFDRMQVRPASSRRLHPVPCTPCLSGARALHG